MPFSSPTIPPFSPPLLSPSLQLHPFPAMLSAFPPTFPADSFLGNPFQPVFPPWETPFLFHLHQEPAVSSPPFSQEPVTSNSGSETLNPAPSSGSDDSNRNKPKSIISGSGYDDENRDQFKNKRSCSEQTNCERKRRRMLSNRESARRSRMRKQKHLENLSNQANRLKLGNREQSNRLRLIVHQTQLFHRENECLRTEAAILRQRIWDIRQVLVVRQLQQLLNPIHNHPNI